MRFRTVAGANATYTVRLSKSVSLLAGLDYQRDAPRRLDLDHYLSTDPGVLPSTFNPITANNLTLGDTGAYVALDGNIGSHVHYDLGWRRDEIQFSNTDLLYTSNSYSALSGVNSPKATFSFLPAGWSFMPSAAFSLGEAFYTNDPRIGTGITRGLRSAARTPINWC